ncbi:MULTISPECIES: hypothetical protein [Pseudomonas]|uniref:Uncharacterized protein n=1 Tax=Pseudomonas fluorescens TaxID=294 RepID=A0A166QRS6_PSEFL|nr:MULTISPECIES: hypothetical protein [Pseudomonas]KZN20759.1 hypothetical protein A1D17_04235 [Pseudomonas fluorescens]
MTYSNEHSYRNDAVPQKSVTDEMREYPHGVHNYDEYRQVLTVAFSNTENIHFWARHGLLRTLNRKNVWIHAHLSMGSHHVPEDEIDLCLDYAREVGPLLNEFRQARDCLDEFYRQVSDHAASEQLLSLTMHADQNLLYWAQIGLIEGIKSQRFFCEKVLAGEMDHFMVQGLNQDIGTFMDRTAKLLACYDKE